MKKIIFLLTMLFSPCVFAATLTTNTIPYVCQGGTNPQLCNSNITTDNNGNVPGPIFSNNIQVFTSSGTWIKPAGATRVYVKVFGAGGNGAATGNSLGDGGGGGGGYAEGVIAVTGNVTVTIGSTNSFAGSTTISATAGSNGSSSYGGAGGVGSGGAINLTGGTGGNSDSQSVNIPGGMGGACPMGGPGGTGGGMQGGSGIAPGNGGKYGGGGGGATNVQGGGIGDPGAVIVYY